MFHEYCTLIFFTILYCCTHYRTRRSMRRCEFVTRPKVVMLVPVIRKVAFSDVHANVSENVSGSGRRGRRARARASGRVAPRSSTPSPTRCCCSQPARCPAAWEQTRPPPPRTPRLGRWARRSRRLPPQPPTHSLLTRLAHSRPQPHSRSNSQ